jgi:hypothetical protein
VALTIGSFRTENSIFFVGLQYELDFGYNICNAITSRVMFLIQTMRTEEKLLFVSYKSCTDGQRVAMFSVTTSE